MSKLDIEYVLGKVREGYPTSSAIAEQYILEHGGADRYFRVRAAVSPKLRALERQGYIKRAGVIDGHMIRYEAVE